MKTDTSLILAVARRMKSGVVLLQLVSGLAAFGLSAATSAFVIGHVVPEMFVPVAAGISLDLAKVSSIFMNRFAQNRDPWRKTLSAVWRLMLIGVAALFTCITVSGMLLNKNESSILSEKQGLLKQQNQAALVDENKRYQARSTMLESEMAKERVTGIGPRYKQLEKELATLEKEHAQRLTSLDRNLDKSLNQLQQQRFSQDRRNNDKLFENFKETMNENFKVDTTYTFWILLLVAAIASLLELTIYIIFDNLACTILPYVRALQDQNTIEMAHQLKLMDNGREYEQKAGEIVTEGAIREMEEAKNAKVMIDKLENFALHAKNTLGEQIDQARDSLNKERTLELQQLYEQVEGILDVKTDGLKRTS